MANRAGQWVPLQGIGLRGAEIDRRQRIGCRCLLIAQHQLKCREGAISPDGSAVLALGCAQCLPLGGERRGVGLEDREHRIAPDQQACCLLGVGIHGVLGDESRGSFAPCDRILHRKTTEPRPNDRVTINLERCPTRADRRVVLGGEPLGTPAELILPQERECVTGRNLHNRPR